MALDSDEQYKLELIINGAEEVQGSDVLTKWEQDFVASTAERYNNYGERTYISVKQWGVLDRIYDKLL